MFGVDGVGDGCTAHSLGTVNARREPSGDHDGPDEDEDPQQSRKTELGDHLQWIAVGESKVGGELGALADWLGLESVVRY